MNPSDDGLLTLRYSGRISSNYEIGAYDLADAVQGFSDFLQAILRAERGEDFAFKPTVAPFRGGSFRIDFLLHLLSSDTAGLVYSAVGSPPILHTILKTISDTFELLKHLKGEPPKSVARDDGSIRVENNQGIINNFGPNSIVVLSDPAVSKAARNFVGRPLERSADTIEVMADEKVIASATVKDSSYFVPLDVKDVLAEHVSQMHVVIQTAVLEGGNRWKFNDGKSTFTAPIEDPEFLSAVAEGREAFRKGDELVVEMQSIQKRVNGKLRAEYIVKRVLRHMSPPPQRAFL